MNASYLSQLFRKETDKTFMELKNELRISLAKEYLKNTSWSISQICEMCGYKDYFHFNKTFKKYVGFTPSKFR